MNELSPSSIVLKYIENINAGDLEGLASMTSEVYKFTDIKGYVEIVRGEESVKRFWDGYFTPHPNYKIHVHHVLKGGDGVAIVGKTTGSHVPPEIEENSTSFGQQKSGTV